MIEINESLELTEVEFIELRKWLFSDKQDWINS